MPNQTNDRLDDLLRRGVAQLGLVLDDATLQKLLDYVALIAKWNKVYNLTAIRDPERMVAHHLLDSLAVMPHMRAGRWLDVGCGAGLPGLVLAICQPEWQITLLDSNTKKTSFVQQAIIELGLHNAKVCSARVEEFRAEPKFDGIISRAFTELGDFLRITRHLIAPDGRWVAMKGSPEDEMSAVPADCRIDEVIPLNVPGLDAARSVVIATPTGECAS